MQAPIAFLVASSALALSLAPTAGAQIQPLVRTGDPVPGVGSVTAIYDVAGRLVKTLTDGPRVVGRHTLLWEGQDERGVRRAAGIYLVRLDSAEGRRTRRLVWVP